MSEAVTVLLVDDHAVVREGYRRLLQTSDCIRVVGEAADAQAAYLAWQEHEPQVTVMDIALPGASGIEALRRIRARAPEAKVLMFSMYEDAVFAARALRAGARGYVTKAAAPQVLVDAVLAVADGRPYIVPGVAQELAMRKVAAEAPEELGLSPREFEVLRLLVDGRPLVDIARTLGLTTKTVANHQTSLRQKLGAGTAVQLLQAASRLGLVPKVPSA